ncbi:hypothetical protein C923_00067 [Plasmodium falciparum UGT5.1]|uniref:Uncharacterized protein n=1 Tax=Plasmodium falciparum UGT5.1 TaxID=1237627 RepID=W7JVV9_PLAFA|nr:hypothetical protein C923_00067 [Plasmodium falciparum UGT5.1]
MKESLHLMIGPVLHSGLSTWFVISTLFFSNKDFTVIFFQTLSLVRHYKKKKIPKKKKKKGKN